MNSYFITSLHLVVLKDIASSKSLASTGSIVKVSAFLKSLLLEISSLFIEVSMLFANSFISFSKS